METFITSIGTKIIVHRPNLTPEEREERMREIEESATRLLKRTVTNWNYIQHKRKGGERGWIRTLNT